MTDGEDVLSLTEQLIAIGSHADAPGREAEIGRFLVGWFRDRGIDAELQPVDGDRSNVIARVSGGDGSSLLLNGHLDTVPAGEMPDAFAPRIEDGVLWGRGACDMKGAIAAMCCAMAAIAGDEASLRPNDSGQGDASLHRDKALGRSFAPLGDREAKLRLAGDLIFAGTVDEESGSLGVKTLIDSGFTADYAVVGEPTSLRVAVAHKGSCFVKVTLTGRGAHGSCPEQGVNAASYAARIVLAIEEELRPRLAKRTHPLLGASTVSIGRICGGTQPNIVAERCEVEVDRRYLPGEGSPVPEIREIVASICGGVEALRYDVVEMPMTSRVPHVPLGTSPESRLPLAAAAVCAEAGLPTEPIGVTYWSDGGHLAASGIETIVLGPGDIADAHGPRDRVAIDELTAAVDLYRVLTLRLLSERK
jgi:succinyl-diaminopimelate desuccinylase